MSISPVRPIPETKLEVVYSADVAKTKSPKAPVAVQPPPSWLRRHWQWVAAIVVIPLSVYLLDRRIDERIHIGTDTRFSNIDRDLKKVSGDIEYIRGKLDGLLAKDGIAEASALPPAELAEKLPEVREAIAVAQKANASIPISDLTAIKTKLASVPQSAPQYWPTTSDVIRSLSQALSRLPPYGTNRVYVGGTQTEVGYVRGGRLERENVTIAGDVSDFTFVDSWIHFTPDAKLTNVRFQNCVFVLPATATPPQGLQDIGKTLLASDIGDVTIG